MTNGLLKENMTKREIFNIMKTKVIILFAFILVTFNGFAQSAANCAEKLSIFAEMAKTKNYGEETYKHLQELRKDCPSFSEAIYIYGERIINSRIDNAKTPADKEKEVRDFIKLQDEFKTNFPAKAKGIEVKKAMVLFENNSGSSDEVFQLLDAGVHFGHKSYRWNPKMFPYIYSEVNNIHILDLVQSATLLNDANTYLNEVASEGKTFLFIGTKRQATTAIAQEAKRCNSYYVNHRWLGGMLTNWNTLSERIRRFKELEEQESTNTFVLLPKKEAALRRKELEKLRKHLDGIKNMEKVPDIAIIIDQKREITAIRECRKLGIPIVSILDTNCDPDLIDIPIPGNDDAVRSIRLILRSLTDSIISGQSKYK